MLKSSTPAQASSTLVQAVEHAPGMPAQELERRGARQVPRHPLVVAQAAAHGRQDAVVPAATLSPGWTSPGKQVLEGSEKEPRLEQPRQPVRRYQIDQSPEDTISKMTRDTASSKSLSRFSTWIT
ncbi:hypothetical protein BGZ92_003335 [Podila epicladia]|nr:hypothetical protein BGZ92_003335 [Podila epicladia]